jgi:hypothetical protein
MVPSSAVDDDVARTLRRHGRRLGADGVVVAVVDADPRAGVHGTWMPSCLGLPYSCGVGVTVSVVSRSFSLIGSSIGTVQRTYYSG